MGKNFIFLFLLCFLGCNTSFSQVKDSVKTTREQLQKIEELSKKGKFTKQLHKLIFKKKPSNINTSVQAVKQKDIDYNFENFQGKIIRKINITTYDPFGFSIYDSARVPKKTVEKIGNKLHLKTKKFTVKSLLLIKPNQTLDSIKVKESERLLRTQRYIRRVSVKPVPIKNTTDSVDIEIKVLDSWSWYPTGSLSTSSGRLTLSNRNFAGLGHYYSNQYRTRFTEGRHAYRSQYQINNIGQTFIDAGVFYNLDLFENTTKQVYASRRFFTPMTRFAGGFTLLQNVFRDSVPNLEGVNKLQNFKWNDLDLWLGHSKPLYYRFNNLHKVQTNLVTSVRYFSRNYTENPSVAYDPMNYYSNQKLYLASIGLASVNYVQDRYIFYYDVIEDIAVGKTFMVTAGLQDKNNITRPYVGAKFSMGKYTNSGYFGGELQWGTFFNNNKSQEGVLRMQGLYFSKLYYLGKWRFRHFFNPEIVVGLNRLNYAKDKITLNGTYGIDGFDSYELNGTKKVLLNFQVQSYAPYEVLGFRFSPFLSTSLGFMGDTNNKFVSNQMYSKIGLGVMISNDYLVFNNFQLSLAFYPNIPGNGKNILKTNNLRNTNFDLQHFNYGKPEIVPYN